MIIGLTGGIGSGKSTVSKFLREFGITVVDADEISRELVRPGMPAWKDIVEKFGQDILLSDGTIDRAKLGKEVFASPEQLKRLNEITHPRIIGETKKRVSKLKLNKPEIPIVVDAALLIESGYYKEMDKVLVVDADEELRVKRIMERDLLSIAEIKKRIQAQMPLKEKLKYADIVIDNNGTKENLKVQLRKICKKLAT